MRRPLAAANWKMNGTLASSRALATDIARFAAGQGGAEIAICPPFVHLESVGALLEGSAAALGGQSLAEQEAGAFTGEVSGAMLADLGCRFVIVGHSERRSLFGETDALVARKFAAAQRHALVPIACVGESLAEREAGQTEAVVRRQLAALLDANPITAFARSVLAYEPVWAIGTGRTATPDQAQGVHALLRALVAERDPEVAAGLRILYGGSVTPANAAELFAQPDVDGGLVGGASLDAAKFTEICRAADAQAEDERQ